MQKEQFYKYGNLTNSAILQYHNSSQRTFASFALEQEEATKGKMPLCS